MEAAEAQRLVFAPSVLLTANAQQQATERDAASRCSDERTSRAHKHALADAADGLGEGAVVCHAGFSTAETPAAHSPVQAMADVGVEALVKQLQLQPHPGACQ